MTILQWLFGTAPRTPAEATEVREKLFQILLRHEIDSIDACDIVLEIEAMKEEPDAVHHD